MAAICPRFLGCRDLDANVIDHEPAADDEPWNGERRTTNDERRTTNDEDEGDERMTSEERSPSPPHGRRHHRWGEPMH